MAIARAIELDEPGVPADACEALALDGDAPVSLREAPERTRAWLRQLAADVGVAAPAVQLAPVDGYDPVAGLDAASDATAVALFAEVQLQPGPDSAAGSPLRDHLLAIAERCGWQLVHEHDASAALLRHREALVAAVDRQRARLAAEGHDVARLLERLRRRNAELRDGRRRGVAWVLRRRGEVDALRLAPAGAGQQAAMRALFAETFGHEMSAAHWQWKYGRGPGRGIVLLDAAGELVAHYAGLTRELRVFGERQLGCQVCDVIVAPRARRSLARRGPMFRLASTFLETQIGWGLPHAIGFGFPSARHHGAADRLGLYEAVDRMVQLSWPATASGAPLPCRSERVVLADGRFAPDQRRVIDTIWQAMAEAMKDVALGVRDARWLQWRFLERPEVDYEVTLLRSRWWRRPLGVLVTRRRDDALEVLDLVAPPAHFPLLIGFARRQAAAAGLPQLRCWITASQQQRLASIDAAAVRVEDLPIDVPACKHTAGPAPALLKARWFLLAGDADFT